MISQGYAAISAKADLTPFSFKRRELGAHDVALDISYAGICHCLLYTSDAADE